MTTRSSPISLNAEASEAGCNRFTIITSTYNAGNALLKTGRSLQEQTHQNIEWLIIDGASKDNTVEVAKSFGSLVSTLISEPDAGIYSAWNKALPLITGDWVLFLGAGDEIYSPDTLSNIAILLSSIPQNITLGYGSVVEVDEYGNELCLRNEIWHGLGGPWSAGRPFLPCHQGVLHRANLFTCGFRFDTKCKIASDSEIMLREFIRGHGADLSMTITRFLYGGISSQRINRLRTIAEIVYINAKIGIFFHRPIYQLSVLASNMVKHVFRLLGFNRI